MSELSIPSFSGKKILITGGLGFIGSSLAKGLLKDSLDITLYDKEGLSDNRVKDIANKVEIVRGNLSNESQVNELVKDKDYIFHLAWQTDLKKSMENPKEDVNIDILGLLNLLNACRTNNPNTKIIFPSTTTVLGIINKIPGNEEIMEKPLSTYEVNKLTAEKFLYMYYKNYNLKSCVLRLSNVFGESQSIDNPNRGVLNFMIGKALRGEPLTVYGSGDFIRDYGYVGNYVDAFLLAASSDSTNGEVYTLGSGKGRTFNEVVETIKEIYKKLSGSEAKIIHVDWPQETNEINKRNFVADFSKFHKATGWYPKVEFEEAIERIIKFHLGRVVN